MSLQIHWHEGLFLQPHHLQRLQKNVFDLVGGERLRTWSYPYGVIEARISSDELENKRIRFDKLRAVMPSGLEIDFPRNAELPAIDIKQAFQMRAGGFRVSLGVPLWQEQRSNAIEPGRAADPRAKLLYKVAEMEYFDENTGENPKPLQLRRINARLLIEDEDASDLEVIPLLRIVRSTSEDSGMPRQDPDFVGPSLVITASPVLREIVRDLAAQLEASRKELVIQLTRGGFSLDTMRGVQFEQVMRLRTLNRYAARLPSLVEAPSVPPYTWYLDLRELLGELVALRPDLDDFDVVPYDHDNPVLAFRELAAKIRKYIRGIDPGGFVRIPFKLENGWLTARFTDDQIKNATDFLLSVKTRDDPRGLAAYVEDGDQFKLMPLSGATRAYFGIPLKDERQAPLSLPAQAELHYFRLLRSEERGSRSWEVVVREKGAIIWASREGTDHEYAFYLLMPSTPAK